MHFRYRNNLIQVIRTTYDAAKKKPRAEIVGRLQRSDPQIGPELVAACTPAEVEEIHLWIASHMRADAVAAEHAARTLAEQCAKAGQWFASTKETESARLVAVEVQQEWAKLRHLLRRHALID